MRLTVRRILSTNSAQSVIQRAGRQEPSRSYKVLSVFQEIHKHLRHLSASCQALGGQLSVAVAVDDAVLYRPPQSVQRKAAGLVRVGKMQLLIRSGGASGVPPEHDGQLLTGDVVVGAEHSVSIAAHDAILICPYHSVCIPLSGGHICKDNGELFICRLYIFASNYQHKR